MTDNKKIAVILVRGMHDVSGENKSTMQMLNLNRRNLCVIVPATRSMLGMISKIKNYVTYGEVDEETLKLLKEKKGDSQSYRLNSPRKGYGRKGIKRHFSHGGGLGYRGKAINDLIKRMVY